MARDQGTCTTSSTAEPRPCPRSGLGPADVTPIKDHPAKQLSLSYHDCYHLIACVFMRYLVLVLLAAVVAAAPLEITAGNFEQHFGRRWTDYSEGGRKFDWFVMFYTPNCGHCRDTKPIFHEASEKIIGDVKFALVNCQIEKMMCKYFGAMGFPTLLFLRKDGVNYKFGGVRSVENFTSFVKSPETYPESIEVSINDSWLQQQWQAIKAQWKTVLVMVTVIPGIFGVLFSKFMDWVLKGKMEARKAAAEKPKEVKGD